MKKMPQPTLENNIDTNRLGLGQEQEIKYASESTPHKTTFTHIYENELLGKSESIYYKGSCGTGATYEYNGAEFVPFLKKFIIDNHVKSVVDLGCGNLGYDKKLYSEVFIDSYHGYDVYNSVQEHNRKFSNHKKYHFYTMDFLVHREEIISADLCIIKDVLQHWLLKDILTFLDYLVESKKWKYIMIVNCAGQTQNIIQESPHFKIGDWRQLSAKMYPLSKYSPKVVLHYKTKEVSVIQCYLFPPLNPINQMSLLAGRTLSPNKYEMEKKILQDIQKK